MAVIAMRVVLAEGHPNADSLRVYEFEAPEHKNVRVVANLSNVYQVGDIVAVAQVGAVLEDGTKIRKAKLRGVESFGMAMGAVGVEVGTDLSAEYCHAEESSDSSVESAHMIKWTSIELLHNIRKTFELSQERLGDEFEFPTVTYRAKVKLDGTNAGVQIIPGKGVVAQSRSRLLSLQDDNMGFAAWSQENQAYFSRLAETLGHCVIFGEWCGQGIQKRAAITEIGRRIFVVFAIQYGDHNFGEATLDIEPERIRAQLPEHPDIYVLPWYGEPMELPFGDRDVLRQKAEQLNQMVLQVEEADPWVEATFGVRGVGEGMVLYPVTPESSQGPVKRDPCTELMFKAKGEKHQVVKQKKPVQLDPEVAKNIEEFVQMFVTENRLEQAVQEGCDGDVSMKKMGGFLRWIGQDIKKEGQAELEASGLEWKQVGKAVTTRARDWFKQRAEAL